MTFFFIFDSCKRRFAPGLSGRKAPAFHEFLLFKHQAVSIARTVSDARCSTTSLMRLADLCKGRIYATH
jgi:hypothetical protein